MTTRSCFIRTIAAWAVVGICGLPGLPLDAQQGGVVRRITLRQAIDIALGQGFQAQAAEAAREAAHYRDDAFYSRLLPQLSVSGAVPAYNRSIIEVLQPDGSTLFRPQNQLQAGVTASVTQAVPLTGGDLFVTSSLSRISVSGTQDLLTWSSTPFSVGIRQPLFRPNTTRWDKREQPVQREVADRQYLEARENVAVQTTILFFDFHAAAVARETASINAGTNDTLYTLNTGRFQVGTIGENDLLQSELALLRARAALAEAELEYGRTHAALLIGLNLPPTQAIQIVVPVLPRELKPDTALAVAEALNNLSIVSSLDLQDVQTQRAITEAKLNNNFGATLTASYGFNATGNNFGRAYGELLNAQRVTLQVDVPLVTWGAGREEVHAAQADREQFTSLAESATRQTEHEARFAALALPQERRSLELSAAADTVAQKRFDVAYNRYVIGRINVDNLYIAQQEKDQARVQYIRALRGYWDAHARLRLVTLYDFERGQRIR
jgi:outer membrane protein TolC